MPPPWSARGGPEDGMTGFVKDLRYAGRMLFKSPGVSVMAIVALALGIGVTATMFSIVYGALMRGLPFEGGDRVMMVWRTQLEQSDSRMGVPIHDYVDWRDQQKSFERLAAYYQGTVNITWSDRPERFDGAFITANGFVALGVQPVLGRSFRPEEERPGGVMPVILSYHLWQDRFHGDPGVLGQAVKTNGEAAEIVGVMPEGFLFPERDDVWVPLREDPLQLPRGGGTWLTVYGKLRPGVTVDQASSEFAGIAQRLATAYPDTNKGIGAFIEPFTRSAVGDDAARILGSMLAVVSLVLLIACANVANLLLARAAVRTKEVGIRTALGAHRWRVVSQMVAEALALALVGGALGAGLAWVGVALFARAIVDTNPPFFLVFKVDAPILLFILGASVLSAVIAGGLPALKASRMDVAGILKDESRGSSSLTIGRMSRFLVVGEISMSLALLVAAGLTTKSITTLRNFDFGFAPDAVFSARVGLFDAEFPDTLSRRAFYNDLERKLAAIPGVTSSSLATVLPGGSGSEHTRLAVEGKSYADDREYPLAYGGLVSPGYFATVGVPVTQGRDFEESDVAGSLPVAIVNESFARKFFPGESALGHTFRPGASRSTAAWLTVVGVVPDLWMQGMQNAEASPAGFYVPLAQSDANFMSILARGPADPMSLTSAVRKAVESVNADTPIYFVNTVGERIAENTWVYNVFGVLFMVFGGVALFLASIGLYAVMAFSVSRRAPEVGIRMALGAARGQVLGLILRQGVVQIGIGVAIGLGLALLVTRTLKEVLFQVSAADPITFVVVPLVLAITGVLATLLPARRATRVDPMIALRSE
jgi:putative ABC transport system permease protein